MAKDTTLESSHTEVPVNQTGKKKKTLHLDVMAHTFNPSTWAAETGRAQEVWGQPDPYSKLQDYTENPCLKKNKQNRMMPQAQKQRREGRGWFGSTDYQQSFGLSWDFGWLLRNSGELWELSTFIKVHTSWAKQQELQARFSSRKNMTQTVSSRPWGQQCEDEVKAWDNWQ